MNRLGCVLGIGILLAAAGVARAAEVTILYTNDLHLRFGRLASIEAMIADERARSDRVILLDAGDTWQDFRTLTAAVWGAERMVAWMNRVGYSAMALGNHDFYWGSRRLQLLVDAATFPVLCSNRVSLDGHPAPFVASAVVEVGGINVLLVGLTTDEYFPYLDYPWLGVVSPADAVRRAIEAYGGEAQLVVCVAHLPIAEARTIAERVPGIDVFVTGHSHERTPTALRVGDTWIVQSGAFGRSLGRLVLDVDEGGHPARLVSNELRPTTQAPADLGRGFTRLFQVLSTLSLLLWVVLS